jgi:hypothetical protein
VALVRLRFIQLPVLLPSGSERAHQQPYCNPFKLRRRLEAENLFLRHQLSIAFLRGGA